MVRELSLERNHRVSSIWNGNIIQCRDRSRDLVGTQEAEDTKLSKTSIVDFSGEATFLGFWGHVLVEAQRIIEVYILYIIIEVKAIRERISVRTSAF